jgi:chaperone modulatory protein CbpM
MSTFTLQSADVSAEELCRICAVRIDYVAELVQEGIIAPFVGSAPDTWRFTSLHVHHAKKASRLQRDLGVNLAGAALALQLLDELETLRVQMASGGADGVVDAL